MEKRIIRNLKTGALAGIYHSEVAAILELKKIGTLEEWIVAPAIDGKKHLFGITNKPNGFDEKFVEVEAYGHLDAIHVFNALHQAPRMFCSTDGRVELIRRQK